MIINNKNYKSNSEGFTLIELLVVIAIIAGLMIIRLTDHYASARDIKRISDMDELTKGLEIYKIKFGQYPDQTDNDNSICTWSNNWDAGNAVLGDADTFIEPLVTEGLIAKTPKETTGIFDKRTPPSQCTYGYRKYPISGTGDAQCDGKTYIILYAALETNNTKEARGDERPYCFGPSSPIIAGSFSKGKISNQDYSIYLEQ